MIGVNSYALAGARLSLGGLDLSSNVHDRADMRYDIPGWDSLVGEQLGRGTSKDPLWINKKAETQWQTHLVLH